MIRIITDSTASIPPEVLEAHDVTVASLYVRFDGEEHLETEMDISGFYGTLASRIDDIPTSSQPSQHAFEASSKRLLLRGTRSWASSCPMPSPARSKARCAPRAR